MTESIENQSDIPPPVNGKIAERNYYLPACVVLAAAIIGTRKAYHQAMDLLPMARRLDSDRFPTRESHAAAMEEIN